METTQEILRHVSSLSYFGIFGLAFLANIVVPVPEEAVILAIGYVAGSGILNFWITLPIVIGGALLSDIIMYFLSLHGNRLVRGAYEKFFSKIVPTNPEFLNNHIGKIVFVSRFMVNLRFLGPFFAGQTRMPFRRFFIIDLTAITIYASVLLWAGHYFANRIEQIFSGIGAVKNIILIVIGAVILISLSQFLKRFFVQDWKITFREDLSHRGYEKTGVPGLWRIKKGARADTEKTP